MSRAQIPYFFIYTNLCLVRKGRMLLFMKTTYIFMLQILLLRKRDSAALNLYITIHKKFKVLIKLNITSKDSTRRKANLFPYLDSFLGTKISTTLTNFYVVFYIKQALQLGRM